MSPSHRPDVPHRGTWLEMAANLMEQSPFGILVCNGAQPVWVNQTLMEQVGCDRDELLTTDPGRPGAADPLCGLLGADARVWVTHPDGGVRCLERVAVDLEDANFSAFLFRDITREAQLEKSLEQCLQRLDALQTHEPDTGLLNLHGVVEALDRQVARSRRYGNTFSVMRLRLAATGGHADEDDIIRGFGEELRDRLRWADEIGHVDRNSFLLLLPETTGESAERLAAKMREIPFMRARSAEGWVIDAVIASWQKGDDCRKLLRRVGLDAALPDAKFLRRMPNSD